MAGGRSNNVFADTGGNVYRRNNDGSWQQRQGGDWTRADVSGGAAGARDRAATAQPRANVQRNADRARNTGSLNRQSAARQRGTQRTQSFRTSGGGRGGGGRRR